MNGTRLRNPVLALGLVALSFASGCVANPTPHPGADDAFVDAADPGLAAGGDAEDNVPSESDPDAIAGLDGAAPVAQDGDAGGDDGDAVGPPDPDLDGLVPGDGGLDG